MLENHKNKYGQYFTPVDVVNFMIGLSNIKKSDKILEPCCGKGVFLKRLDKLGFKNFIGYEIDEKLIQNVEPYIKNKIIIKSFINENFDKKFDLIIGNPPYIRWKNIEENLKKELKLNYLWNKHFNSLCDYLYIFILKSIELLKEGGELIFITPEYWINTQHSTTLRNFMVKNGFFEQIFHFCEAPIFDKVASSVIIFKYIKDSKNKIKRPSISIIKYQSSKKIDEDILNSLLNKKGDVPAEYIKINQFQENKKWILANGNVRKRIRLFEKKCAISKQKGLLVTKFDDKEYYTLKDIANIGNGMVSGLDTAFQLSNNSILNRNEKKNVIKVLKAKNISQYSHGKTTKYIFINEKVSLEEKLKEKYPNFYNQLNQFKNDLNKRYNYDKDIKYWQWVFLRNFSLFNKKQARIFVPCKERISNKNFFRFTFVKSGVYPTQDVTAIFIKGGIKENIYYILSLLNNHRVFNWLKYKGVIKGNIVEFSERPLNSIPIRLINWDNKKEILLHNKISLLCRNYIKKPNNNLLKQINKNIDYLF